MFFWFVIGCLIAYILGYLDGRYFKPPPPERGTYDSGEDRVDEYGDWH
jgi:hypothetical protein